MVQNNFHTHTLLCKHAEGFAVDYVREAVASGSTAIGISDHMPTPDNKWNETRMHINDLNAYEDQIAEARKAFPKTTILKGLECEYVQHYGSLYKDLFRAKEGCDYLIGAVHYYPSSGGDWKSSFFDVVDDDELRAFARYCVKTMESGLFDFLAHPDNFGYCYHKAWGKETAACCKEIFVAAEALQIPLEINGNGMNKKKIATTSGERHAYPLDKFWELASDYNVKVIVNSDAHKPKDVLAHVDYGLGLVRRFGLNLIPSFEAHLPKK